MSWSSILNFRYRNPKLKVLIRDKINVNNRDSIWWRDLLLSDNYVNLKENHFAGAAKCTVGNRWDIPLWYSCWTSNHSLLDTFPEIFAGAADDDVAVADTGFFTEVGWEWNLNVLVHYQEIVSGAVWLEIAETIQQFSLV